MTERTCNIAVVGAGAVGLSAALAFARDGFDTVLIGGLDTRRDGRTVALLNGSVRFLEALGAWPELVKNAAPLETMRIADAPRSRARCAKHVVVPDPISRNVRVRIPAARSRDLLDIAWHESYLLRVMRTVLSAAMYYYAPRSTGRVRRRMR